MRNFDKLLINIVGDIVISSGFIAYLGVFTVSSTQRYCEYSFTLSTWFPRIDFILFYFIFFHFFLFYFIFFYFNFFALSALPPICALLILPF